MKKIKNSIFSIFLYPSKLLKKTKIDNFVGGLIFGAIFSLIVNILTVKIQEDITRQRFLESLEAEMVMHVVNSNGNLNSLNYSLNSPDNDYLVEYSSLSSRYSTKVGNSNDILTYLFELDPEVRGKIESYYSIYIDRANKLMDRNENYFYDSFKECDIQYISLKNIDRKNKKECNDLVRLALYSHDPYGEPIVNLVQEIRKDFHPTQDRLNSAWLRLLLGNKSIEILKN